VPSRRYALRQERLARNEERIAAGLVIAYAVVFGVLSLIRHWSFHSTGLDLGVFDQVLWNTSQGRFMASTLSLDRCVPHSFFGDHFSPILVALVPLYWIAPHPETLLVVQTIALAAGALPLYLLARALLPRGIERLIWVSRTCSARRSRSSRCTIPRGLALGRARVRHLPRHATDGADGRGAPHRVHGQGGGASASASGSPSPSGTLAERGLGPLSAAVFVVTLKVIIPRSRTRPIAPRPVREPRPTSSLTCARWSDPCARSLWDRARSGRRSPSCSACSAPGCCSPALTMGGVPSIVPLGYLLLSDYGGEHTLHNQYGAPIIPLAIGASIVGFAKTSPRWRTRAVGGVVLATLFFGIAFGGWPFSRDFENAYLRGNPDRAPSGASMFVREPRYDALLAQVHLIPSNVAIASTDFWVTQVGERRLNYHVDALDPCDAQYVILDYADPSMNRDLGRFADARAAIIGQGFDEIASGPGLSLLRRR
jgi:hypothetical protein